MLGAIDRYCEARRESCEGPTRRFVLAGTFGTALHGVFGSVALARQTSSRIDILVDPDPRHRGVRTLADALAQAATIAAAGSPRVRILLADGVYREKLTITQPGIEIVGRKASAGGGAIIVFDAAAGKRRPDGTAWGTGGSATVTLVAPGIRLRNLTIRNDFDYLADQITHASGGAQAVALSVAREADGTRIDGCTIEGYQDTLYLSARTHIRDCRISGNVDFIFGGAAALIERCTIVSRYVPGTISGFIAAPSTPASEPYGLVFRDCRLTREAGVPDGTIFLGRPWRAGGNMSLLGMAAYLDCWMDAHIARAGWTSMGFRGPDGVSRQLMPLEARLYESNSRGPGKAEGALRRQLSPTQIAALRAHDIRGRMTN